MRKMFNRDNLFILIIGPSSIIVTILLTVLYDVNPEYSLYFVFFSMLFWIASLVELFKLSKKKLERDVPKDEEILNDDKIKWLEAKEKEDFFALWAHQIKTPIAAMNLLFQAEEPNLRQCKDELFKIENYVEMALNYLRYDTMSNDLALEYCDLEKMTKAVVKKYRSIFINKHLSIALEDLDHKVLTDEKWFSFVLEQILSNALKYTKAGGITISAKLDNEAVTVCVKDSGIGIKAEDLPRIFEKGFTGYNGRMDKKASGIGMYLCKAVSDKLGHKLWIESEENVGTSVYIAFAKEKVERESLNKM